MLLKVCPYKIWKSTNRSEYQNQKTEFFGHKNRKTDLKNSQNRKTENPNALPLWWMWLPICIHIQSDEEGRNFTTTL